MASAFSHAVTALSIGSCFYRPQVPKRVWIVGAICGMFPDVDVLGFRYGIHYGDFWGHRGFTHSLLFAALLSGCVVLAAFRVNVKGISRSYLGLYVFLATASHGALDAMTNGGLGVAFFSPLNDNRYFFPWRPILVSPISASRFFSSRGLAILQNELVWIWLPSMVFGALVLLVRRKEESCSTAPARKSNLSS